MIDLNHPRPIAWEQFRKRSTNALFPIPYYFRPFTITRRGFPSINSYAYLSFGPTNRQSLIDRAGFDRVQTWLVGRCLRRPEIISRQVVSSRRFARRWLAWCRKSLKPDRIRRQTTAELIATYQTYQRFYEQYSLLNVFYWAFAGDRLIETLEQRLRPIIPSADERARALELLTTPSTFSFIQEEAWAFVWLVRQSRRRPRPWVEQQLLEHSHHYGWIPWDYVGPTYWTPADLKRRLRSWTGARAEREYTHLRSYRTSIRSRQRRLIRTFCFPRSLIRLATATQMQAILQDDKKAVTTESHYYLHFLQREAARQLRQKSDDLYFFSFDEILNALHGKSLPDVRQRRRHCIIFVENGVLRPVHGRMADQWYATMERSTILQSSHWLQGTSASGGVAVGRVKKVFLPKDIRKVKHGDILVTQMTTPEFIPAMKKAAAFVTDEGGLTCHAAIVSREMRKPCIIGTKISTKVLRDGDRVEVDAERGVVRKINTDRRAESRRYGGATKGIVTKLD